MTRRFALRVIVRCSAALALALACTMGFEGCSKSRDDTPQPLVNVEAEHPETGTISEPIIADATLFPLAQAAISPKITAPVRTFYVQRGSKVKKGQLLAVLEDRDLTAQALDNKGQFTAAEAAYSIANQSAGSRRLCEGRTRRRTGKSTAPTAGRDCGIAKEAARAGSNRGARLRHRGRRAGPGAGGLQHCTEPSGCAEEYRPRRLVAARTGTTLVGERKI